MRARTIRVAAPSARHAANRIAGAKEYVRRSLPELALGLFCFLNLVWVAFFQGMEAFPIHFIYISVSVVFGLRMWTVRSSVLALIAVSVPAFLLILRSISVGRETPAELAEVPLMALLFLVMVWHVRKRQFAAEHERALFANASHELMTPLTIAWGELELLGRDGSAPTVEEFQETRRIVLEELHRGQVLAAGLLTLSRLDTTFSAQQSMTSTDYLLDAAVRRWSAFTNHPITVGARAGGELSCVRPDIGLLLDNLIENALRHTPDGSKVTLAARSRGHHLVLEVSDEGDGIPDEALPYIFDRFYRARSADGTRGSGLGLAIVKAIAESHRGTVDVESEIGVGTTFRVELPGFECEPAERRIPLPV
ncbi:MAG: two-component system, OmpR family, sensor kinase [Gaiellales bacterium]|nr:two-component system, OmpR family, sensor kinase [Gaiellales bacterium]